MSTYHCIFNICESPQKHTKFKILSPIDDSLAYYLKSRKKENITPSKSEFYLMDSEHKYISSIYPINKPESFTGLFELTDGGTYVFDYKRTSFNLSIDGQHITFSKGDK